MKISFLIHSLYNVGGTIRTTLSTATALADRGHEIELVTVFRRRTVPVFAWDERFRVIELLDTRKSAEPLSPADAKLAAKPARVFPRSEGRYAQYNRLTDRLIADYLRGCDADVIVGTRPGLNVFLAKYAPKSAIRVAQEHLFLSKHGRRLTRRLYSAYRRLDAVTTVSATDARHYRQRMPRIADRVEHIPNSVPATPLPPADGEQPLIVAAGRLESIKRYDLLLAAFATVIERHPDWRLRIYGHGKQAAELRELVDRLALNDTVMLMGSRHPIDAEWVKGSIAAVTSDMESFGLTLVEAMDCGLPVVSTACPYGPPEIIDDGQQGLLTPPGDADAFAEALCRLIENPALRHDMATAGRKRAAEFSPDSVADRYEDLFTRLVAARRRAVTPPSTPSVKAVRPASTVDCRSVTFEQLELTSVPPGRLTWWREDSEIAVPAPPAGVLSDWSELAEGDWLLHRDGQPVSAGYIDSRALLRAPEEPPGTVVVPFADKGIFGVRVWRRDRFAEVTTVRCDGEVLTVGGQLVGAFPGDGLRCHIRHRKQPDVSHTVDVDVEASAFTAVIPLVTIAGDSRPGDLWDLWLDAGGRQTRIARLLDDVAHRKSTQRHPVTMVSHPRPTWLQPYFTVNNELSIRVKPDPATTSLASDVALRRVQSVQEAVDRRAQRLTGSGSSPLHNLDGNTQLVGHPKRHITGPLVFAAMCHEQGRVVTATGKRGEKAIGELLGPTGLDTSQRHRVQTDPGAPVASDPLDQALPDNGVGTGNQAFAVGQGDDGLVRHPALEEQPLQHGHRIGSRADAVEYFHQALRLSVMQPGGQGRPATTPLHPQLEVLKTSAEKRHRVHGQSHEAKARHQRDNRPELARPDEHRHGAGSGQDDTKEGCTDPLSETDRIVFFLDGRITVYG